MRGMLLVLAGILGLAGCASLPGQAGAPRVFVAPDAAAPVRHAAEELRTHLGQMTGETPALVTDPAALPGRGDIVLGPGGAADALLDGVDPAAFGPEEYLLRTVDGVLVIAGGAPRGTLYGAYALLEDHLGVRWFTPEVTQVPRVRRLRLPVLDERHAPVLEYREPFVKDCFDGDWAARNRMNSFAASLEARHGGKVQYHGFVHTFDALLPPAEHFEAHPEWFALVGGKRLGERTQLCCTHPEVMARVADRVRDWMRGHPEATVFSVSQNDWDNHCECDRCQALAEAEESQMAPVLALVNHVADAVAEEFPDKVVDTLAYQWTRKAPKTLRPRPNVVVRLCSIECCFTHPFATCDSPENRGFVADVKDWSQRCDRLWVWNYNTSYAHYFVPFPNLRVRAENIRFFRDHHVTGIFEQDVYTTLHGEFSGLSGYLGAKLLWNPDRDPEPIIDEYLHGVYGAAAPALRRYLDLIHDEVTDKNIHLDIWIGPDAPHLNDALLAEADALFAQAEAAVAGEPATLERVRIARLSVDYAILERLRGLSAGAYVVDHEQFRVSLEPAFRMRLDRFFDTAERHGVTAFRESDGALETYKGYFAPLLRESILTPLEAVPAPAGLAPGLRYEAHEGDWWLLPDFAALTPLRAGRTAAPTLAVATRKERMGLRFSGWFHAHRDGVYRFGVRSNDGSRIWVGDTLLVDNDGLHGAQTRTAHVALRAGHHPIRIDYFDAGGTQAFEVSCEGPGLPSGPLGAPLLWHLP
jgi:hypothetical protein